MKGQIGQIELLHTGYSRRIRTGIQRARLGGRPDTNKRPVLRVACLGMATFGRRHHSGARSYSRVFLRLRDWQIVALFPLFVNSQII